MSKYCLQPRHHNPHNSTHSKNLVQICNKGKPKNNPSTIPSKKSKNTYNRSVPHPTTQPLVSEFQEPKIPGEMMTSLHTLDIIFSIPKFPLTYKAFSHTQITIPIIVRLSYLIYPTIGMRRYSLDCTAPSRWGFRGPALMYLWCRL
jgi:hypothetical protein